MLRVRELPLSGGYPGPYPTAVAFPRKGGKPLFGPDAVTSPYRDFDLLINWKLLLGLSNARLSEARILNPNLDNILKARTLTDVCSLYFEHILSKVENSVNLVDKPQIIVGIPAISDLGPGGAWRTNYRKNIETALKRINYPSPAFFHEPFAVFQFHRNRGDIVDTGDLQNILVVDIGGGTTNICAIQTTTHGRLARGGANHVPQAVYAIEIGGANIDRWIVERKGAREGAALDGEALYQASLVKERLSTRIDSKKCWSDTKSVSEIAVPYEIFDLKQSLSGYDLKEIIEEKFWPRIKDVIKESIGELKKTNTFRSSVLQVDAVIFAGGTCQIGFIPELFKKEFSTEKIFTDKTRYIVSSDFQRAVAHGLAIEARANKSHQIRPSRVAPFIQDHILMHVSHRRDDEYLPGNLKVNPKSVSGQTKNGIIIEAPANLSSLSALGPKWSFDLRQRPDVIYFRFDKVSPATLEINNEAIPHCDKMIVASRRDRAGTQIRMSMIFNEDGFVQPIFQTILAGKEVGHNNQRPYDLHDLSSLEGSHFFGIDFGSHSTLISYTNVDDNSAIDVLPDAYKINAEVLRRAFSLERDTYFWREEERDSDAILKAWNDKVLVDYIYHSNRIEGSLLDRGQTETVVREVEDDRTASAAAITHRVSQLRLTAAAYVDDRGDVRTVSRIVRDAEAAANLRDAYRLVHEWASDAEFELSSFRLRELHQLVTRGDAAAFPGQFRKEPVTISQTTFVPPDFTQVDDLVVSLFRKVNAPDFIEKPSIIQAAEFHTHFVSIHPFSDGNGRVARLLANFFLWRKRLPGLLLNWESRDRYYDALEECNSTEIDIRGEISDLCRLFCDLYEEAFEQVTTIKIEDSAAQFGSESAETALVTLDNVSFSSSPLDHLLGRLSRKRATLSIAEQYSNWRSSFLSLLSDVRKSVERANVTLKDSQFGRIELREYPLIEEDIYWQIRNRERFSKTWYFRLRFFLEEHQEELIFFFASCSAHARSLDPDVISPSLLISRFSPAAARHVGVGSQPRWSRVLEFVHNGVDLGVMTHSEVAYGEKAGANHWFALLMEDVLVRLAKIELDL